MKKVKQSVLFIGITLVSAVNIQGCKSSEEAVTQELKNKGEIEI